jgi:hypothetical protein
MAALVLGPLLRYVGETQATVWVETDGACEVEVLGHRAATFHAEGHHYGLVLVEGLEPGRTYEYEVRLDGELVWPEPGGAFPPSSIRTLDPDDRERPLKLVFGSCRVAAPHEPPYTLPKHVDERGREVDALRTFALRMLEDPPEAWPHALFLLGDQVYADDTSPGTREFIEQRRDTSQPPGERDTSLPPWEEVADFEEYAHLYLESWGEPVLRWLLSTVPSAMIFDDHDVHDDWNTSAAWLAAMRAQPWWQERIESGLASYWIYQHLGNLSPADLAEDPVYAKVQAAEDAGPLLRQFAAEADRETEGTRWSYHRDFGTTRLLVIDSRCGRVLDERRRDMLDPQEWRWVEEHMTGEFDHLLVATSLPFLLAPGAHHVEAWNEAVCAGAWGRLAARLGEQLRQAADLEHWAAFGRSFERLARLLVEVASGRRGPAPSSVVVLSGDVHHAYLARVDDPPGVRLQSKVYQAVCSPLRNALEPSMRRAHRLAETRTAERIARALARLAGVKPPPISWRILRGPWFDNQVATLNLDGRGIELRIERAPAGHDPDPSLERVLDHRLAEPAHPG